MGLLGKEGRQVSHYATRHFSRAVRFRLFDMHWNRQSMSMTIVYVVVCCCSTAYGLQVWQHER